MCGRKQHDASRKANAREEISIDVPSDIIPEIISRARVKDLLKWKCVSKSWLNLISSPEFINMHLNQPKKRTRMFVASDKGITDYDHEDASYTAVGKKIDYLRGTLSRRRAVAGSCEGLVCLIDKRFEDIVILNPSTRNFFCVGETNPSCIFFYWFGRHPCTGDCSVVMGRYKNWSNQEDDVITEIQVLNLPTTGNPICLSSSVYQRKQPTHYVSTGRIEALLYETLHWFGMGLNRPDFKIVTYNFRKNEIGEIPAPRTDVDGPHLVGVLDGCLCILAGTAGNEYQLWIMKEYGVNESWSKYTKFEEYRGFRFLMMMGAYERVPDYTDEGYLRLDRIIYEESLQRVCCRHDDDDDDVWEESLQRVYCGHEDDYDVWEESNTVRSQMKLFNSDCIKCWARI